MEYVPFISPFHRFSAAYIFTVAADGRRRYKITAFIRAGKT